MRTGTDRETGRLLTGWDHCAQSIGTILITRVGSRVMRRAFGADVKALQDRNPDSRTMLVVFVAIAQALRQWEPGFRLTRIVPERVGADGVAIFALTGLFYPEGHRGDYNRSEVREARYAEGKLLGWSSV
jgi:uncharacterized protein